MLIIDKEIEATATQLLHTMGNPWHHFYFGSIYTRNPGHHCIAESDKIYSFLDLPNINIHEEYRSQGIFTRLLDILEQFKNIYIENILEKRLELFLINRHYIELGCERPFSYYRLKEI